MLICLRFSLSNTVSFLSAGKTAKPAKLIHHLYKRLIHNLLPAFDDTVYTGNRYTGLFCSLRPGAGRSQAGASLNPSPRYAEASDFFSQKSVYVWIRIAQVAAHFYPRKRKKKPPHLHLHLSPFVFIGFGEVSPAGFIRSLNRRTDALERRLYSFHANKLRSLACGTPHWGDASFVCPNAYSRRNFKIHDFDPRLTPY